MSVMTTDMLNIHGSGPVTRFVGDIAKLSDLTPDTVSHVLQQRMMEKLLFTWAGSVLISLNPFCDDHNTFSQKQCEEHSVSNATWRKQHPHIYAIGMDIMDSSSSRHTVQVQGESAAGKTRLTAELIRFFGTSAPVYGCSLMDDLLLAINVLDAFGTATTSNNLSSSRYAKHIMLEMDGDGHVVNTLIHTYMFEKSRVVDQPDGDSNFAILHLLADVESLTDLESSYLPLQPATPPPLQATDKSKPQEELGKIWAAIERLGVDEKDRGSIFALLSAILWLGTMEDMMNMERYPKSLETVASAYGVGPKVIEQGLTHRQVRIGGKVNLQALPLRSRLLKRDAFAKATYDHVFKWLVSRFNKKSSSYSNGAQALMKNVGVLDHPGLEVFKVNSHEQLMINFINEKTQLKFIKHVVDDEKAIYTSEGIPWIDHQLLPRHNALETLEGPLGILSFLNQESRSMLPKVDNLITTLTKNLPTIMRRNPPRFVIQHYARDIEYTMDDRLIQVNKDQTPSDIFHEIVKGTSSDFVSDVLSSFAKSAYDSPTHPSMSTQIAQSYDRLVENIEGTEMHHVRCLKSNDEKRPWKCDLNRIGDQLKTSGLLPAAQIAREGYRLRLTKESYKLLYYDKVDQALDGTHLVKHGISQVFIKEDGINWLNRLVDRKARSIQRFWRREKWRLGVKKIVALWLREDVRQRLTIHKMAFRWLEMSRRAVELCTPVHQQEGPDKNDNLSSGTHGHANDFISQLAHVLRLSLLSTGFLDVTPQLNEPPWDRICEELHAFATGEDGSYTGSSKHQQQCILEKLWRRMAISRNEGLLSVQQRLQINECQMRVRGWMRERGLEYPELYVG